MNQKEDLRSEEALAILAEHSVTKSIQQMLKWIRDGKIPAIGTSNRKEGYTIKRSDLMQFIFEKRPDIKKYLERIAELETEVQRLRAQTASCADED